MGKKKKRKILKVNKIIANPLLIIAVVALGLSIMWLLYPIEEKQSIQLLPYYSVEKGINEPSYDQVCNTIFNYLKNEQCVSGIYCVRKEEFPYWEQWEKDFAYSRYYAEYDPGPFERPIGYSYREWVFRLQDSMFVVYPSSTASGLGYNDVVEFPGIRCVGIRYTNNFEDLMKQGLGPRPF